jgi:hypothetical protein
MSPRPTLIKSTFSSSSRAQSEAKDFLLVLDMPVDLLDCVAVENKADRVLVVVPNTLTVICLSEDGTYTLHRRRRYARNVIAVSELVAETLAFAVEQKTAAATECLGCEELDLGVGVLRVNETGRVHLHFLKIDALSTDLEDHLVAVTGTVLAVGSS